MNRSVLNQINAVERRMGILVGLRDTGEHLYVPLKKNDVPMVRPQALVAPLKEIVQ
jgi:hypothetical protein